MKKIGFLVLLFCVVISHGFAQNIPIDRNISIEGDILVANRLLGNAAPSEFDRSAGFGGGLHNGGNIIVFPDSNGMVWGVQFLYDFVNLHSRDQVRFVGDYLTSNGWAFLGSRQADNGTPLFDFLGNGMFIQMAAPLDGTNVVLFMERE